MSDTLPTAQIIVFPRRVPPASEQGQERLRRALAGLESAVAGQSAAIAAWRSSLAELGTVVSGLNHSLQRYRGSLDTLDTRVTLLHDHAVQLERSADAALQASPGSPR